jgi:branched-chain amino acid transport system ATP-binding protein
MSETREDLLQIRNLTVAYNGIVALRSISMSVGRGEVVSVLGPNGAGKTTLLRTISGLVRPEAGASIRFQGKEIVGCTPYRIAKGGIAHVPEGRQVFPAMSVNENLEVASVRIPRSRRRERIDSVYDLFSELVSRKDQQAGSLSGGEQQMLAIGRAIVSECELVLIDEPSMGLAPIVVQRIFKTLKDIVRDTALTLLLVEQNAKLSLPLSDRIYVLSQGAIAMEGPVSEIHGNQMIQDMYFAKG